MTHTITIGAVRVPPEFFYRCACGATTTGLKTRQMAEDASDKHLRFIVRVQTTLAPRGGSLSAAHSYYREMADNPEVSEADRTQWRMLAETTGRRLGIGLDEPAQEELFTL